VLKAADVRQVSYVPDAGHSRLIELLHADSDIQTTVLTTEEEGIALSAGAWLGGQRSVLLMQSSGVGNCINMLGLMASCRFPLLTLVTMRGEWAEFNPWQVPMGRATPGALELMGVKVLRVDAADDVEETVSAAAALAFDSDQQVAVLLSQRLLGRKKW
jgi:sulfopyruvate decarboxylase alpha subunit